ncbi:DUF2187 family protein [Niallia sp. HCP3S3_B10]|uniref:DUF2187 family protein n=1 Tax=Niallia sp. HCP3S3_B10 TaxID=3438944 RepID=UPI003F88914A
MDDKKIRAKIDDVIIFLRANQEVTGVVTLVKENSVIVQLSSYDTNFLQYESNLTVVNHKNYTVLAN